MIMAESNSGQFQRGREKSGGRQKGSVNKATGLVKNAFIDAALMAGDALAHERAQEILKQTGDTALAQKIRDEQGGVAGYLFWAAINEPVAFLAAFSKVIPQHVQVDEKTEVVYRTSAELRQALLEEGVPINEIMPVLLELKANEPTEPGPTGGDEK